MKNPNDDSFDRMLDDALQRASHSIEGKTFGIHLTERIAKLQRRMMLWRMLPTGMGLLSALVVFQVGRPKFDFHIGILSLAPVWENCRPALEWLMQPVPGTQNLLFLWVLLAGMALLLSNWFASRESAIFRF